MTDSAKWIPWDDGWFYGVMCSGCLRQYQGTEEKEECPNCGRAMKGE